MNCGLPVTHKETVVSSAGPRPRATCLHCLSGTTKSSLLAEAESWAAQTLLWPSTTVLTPVSTPGTDQGMQAAAAGRCQACHCSHSGLCSPSQHWSQTALDDVSSGQRAGSRGGDGVAGKEGELSRSPRHLAEVGPVSLSRIKAFSQGWPSHQPHSDCCSTLFSLKKRERKKPSHTELPFTILSSHPGTGQREESEGLPPAPSSCSSQNGSGGSLMPPTRGHRLPLDVCPHPLPAHPVQTHVLNTILMLNMLTRAISCQPLP